MLEHFNEYGYQGVFFALIAAGFGFPIPEELPVITAGVLVGHEDTTLRWYIMLPVVMAGVVIGDGVLYGIGRFWGRRLLDLGWVQRQLRSAGEAGRDREELRRPRDHRSCSGPGCCPASARRSSSWRACCACRSGASSSPTRIYAIPMVNVLFWLSYMLTDQVLVIFNKINAYRPLVVVAILLAGRRRLIQKYVFSRHVSTGEPPHVPKIISKPAGAVGHAVESAVEKVTGRHPLLEGAGGKVRLGRWKQAERSRSRDAASRRAANRQHVAARPTLIRATSQSVPSLWRRSK